MLRSELRDNRDAHGIIGGKASCLLGLAALQDISQEHRQDWQTEVLDALQAIITHCESVAQICEDQIDLQSSDHAIRADADRESAA